MFTVEINIYKYIIFFTKVLIFFFFDIFFFLCIQGFPEFMLKLFFSEPV
jgi:hypothetical protein